MDEFDFKEEKTAKGFRPGSALLNCGSLFLFLSAVVVGGFVVLLFFNPQSGFNPFPPAAATATQAATNTPTATAEIISSPTETPTATAEPPTPTSTVDQIGGFFELQAGSPSRLDSSVFHPELGCDFMGVAGQAFNLDGAPIADLRVHVSGTLGTESVDKFGLTGAATQYGAGEYYEIQLANQPVASDSTLQVTLLDAAGQAISDSYSFSTTASCQENLIMVNFVEQP